MSDPRPCRRARYDLADAVELLCYLSGYYEAQLPQEVIDAIGQLADAHAEVSADLMVYEAADLARRLTVPQLAEAVARAEAEGDDQVDLDLDVEGVDHA